MTHILMTRAQHSRPPAHRANFPLFLMAKPPQPGRAKTRMSPPLSAARAAELARKMLAQSAARACRHWRGEVVLCAAAAHPVFAELAERHAIRVTRQPRNADLGARMLHALQGGIAAAGRAAVMGCDVPHFPGAMLARAHALLARGENAVGPAADGGFYLLGLQRAEETLFAGVDWNGASPLAQLSARAKILGMQFTALPELRDIDRYADLEWLAAREPAYQTFLAQ